MLLQQEEIVGRDDEIAEITRLVEEIEAHPRHLVLEGEAGIGKTILWRDALERARAGGVVVLATSPGELETPLAFSGLRDLFEDVYDDVADALPLPQKRALDVALLRAEPSGGSLDRGAVAAAFLGSLRLLADRARVLVAVDDLQWLDGPTRFIVNHARRRLREESVAFLLALRAPAEAVDQPPGARAELRITLGPLSVGALHRIVRTQLGASPSRPTLVRLHELCGGNPFFGLEIARALQRRGGEDSGHALPLPSRLQDFVGERLATLPRETIEALQVTAALSHPTVTLVAEVSGGTGRALDAAVVADVLRTDGERLVFTHPLLATGAYSTAGPVRRREIHGRLATLVDDPEETARHLALAASGPDPEVAMALEHAAKRARSRGAPAVAAELAKQALGLTPSADAEGRQRRAAAAAGSLFEAGDAGGAATLFERAVEMAPSGPARAEALAGLGRAWAYAANLRSAARIFEQAIGEAEAVSAVQAEAQHGLAVALFRLMEDLGAAEEHARRAVEIAAGLGDPHALREFRASLALIRRLQGKETSQPGGDDMTDPGGDPGRSRFLTTLYGPEFMSSVQAVLADDFANARAGFERVSARATESGDEASLPLVLRYLSFVELLAGDWTRAQQVADEGYEAALLTGQRSQQAVIAASKALIAAHRGDADATRHDADEALRLVEETGSGFADLLATSALGLLELSLGNAEGATARLEPLLDRVMAAGVGEPGATRFVPDLVEARLRLGRTEEAAALLAAYEQKAVRLDRPSALAASARCRAVVAAAETGFEAALAAVDEALGAHARVAMPFERARTLLVRGGIERRARRKRAAREALAEALAVFDELGAQSFAEQASLELGRIGGRAPAGSRLTPTERRVARLVAEGRSTKEVAASLFVSPKTVEGHLSRIYAKLGVHSRTALARELSDRD
jgi:DNA-binding CsgD family transcriptional regulator